MFRRSLAATIWSGTHDARSRRAKTGGEFVSQNSIGVAPVTVGSFHRSRGCCGRLEFGFPIAHFFYQLLIDAANGFCGQRTTLGELLSLLYYLLLPVGNRHRGRRLALEVAHFLDHSGA